MSSGCIYRRMHNILLIWYVYLSGEARVLTKQLSAVCLSLGGKFSCDWILYPSTLYVFSNSYCMHKSQFGWSNFATCYICWVHLAPAMLGVLSTLLQMARFVTKNPHNDKRFWKHFHILGSRVKLMK